VLVNNAGIQYVARSISFRREMGRDPVNQPVVGVSCDAVGHPAMRKNKFGRIINIASRMGWSRSIQGGLCRREARHHRLTKVAALETAEEVLPATRSARVMFIPRCRGPDRRPGNRRMEFPRAGHPRCALAQQPTSALRPSKN